jgi:iron complex transport system substrate-binding protein
LPGCARAPAPPTLPSGKPSVVSLNPCTDAILAEVTDAGQVLAISHYSKDVRASSMDPAVAQHFTATRGTVEEVVALAPDLVIGSTFTDPATRRAYARMGLRLETFGAPATVEQGRAQVRQIAALVGQHERGEALVARIDAALLAARPPAGAATVDAVLWQAGGMVAGEQTLVMDLMAHTGFANFAGARGFGQGDRVSLERMLADPPRAILVAGLVAGAGGMEDFALGHPVLERLQGTDRVPLDQRLLFCGGPTIALAATRLAQIRDDLAWEDGR